MNTEMLKDFLEVQKELKPVKKDGANPFHKSKYATFESVLDEALPVLHKHGFILNQIGGTDVNSNQTLRTIVTHVKTGNVVTSDFILVTTKNDPQSIGSSITYFKRYAIQALLGMSTEDDDGQAATHKPKEQQAPPKSKPAELPNAADKLKPKKADQEVTNDMMKALGDKAKLTSKELVAHIERKFEKPWKHLTQKEYNELAVMLGV